MASLDDVLITDQLFSRPSRVADLQAECDALHALVQQVAERPKEMLDSLVQIAVDLCHAETAGVSLIEATAGGTSVFRWMAVAGHLYECVGEASGRDSSMCGICVDRNAPQLFRSPARYFTALERIRPPLLDCLILPFTLDGRPIGAIWVVTHTKERNFDREDVRIMTSLASVTSAAFRLRSTVEELASTQERMRFATRLHDMLNETLFAVALRLDWCLRHSAEPHALRGKLGEVQQDVRAMMEQIRTLIGEQSGRSPARGLSEKVRALATEIRSLTGLTVDVVREGDDAALCDRHVEILQHVVQEALVNVAKHARATRATVTLAIGRDEVHFEIVDDGRGVPDVREDGASIPAFRSHFGLRQMRERIETAGGAVTFGVNTPHGFRVSGSLPAS